MSSLRNLLEPSRRGAPDSANVRAIGLVLASIVWLLLFLWLGWRLWQSDGLLSVTGNLLLATICVLLGTAVALGWILLLPRWYVWDEEESQSVEWPPLTVQEAQGLTPSEFESYVAYRLFERSGFTVDNRPDVKDGGVDILVVDPMGREAVVQCKRYSSTVGSDTVRELYGTMVHEGAARAYLVVSGRISEDARLWAEGKPITIIDGERLAELARAKPALARTSTPGREEVDS